MKLLFDFFPVIIFFVAYKAFNIYVATAAIIVASVLQLGINWFQNKKVNRMHLATALLVVVFGGVTLFLQNPTFIQWKPTVLNWLFAVVFLGSQFIGEKPIVQRMMEGIYADAQDDSSSSSTKSPQPDIGLGLQAEDWRTLNSMWWIFFLTMGSLNLYVVYNYSEDAWVNFKLFGMLGLTVVFALLQGVWISRKLPADDS